MPIPLAVPVETLRRRQCEAAQHLLGDTISFSDDQWMVATRLPGWTRAHVGSHLARNADAIAGVTLGALQGQRQSFYSSAAQRFLGIERGAERDGLSIQIDLDTSEQRLQAAWDKVADWDEQVNGPSGRIALSGLLLARLREIVVHNIDLGCGFTFGDIDPVPARWLLEFQIDRMVWTSSAIRIESDSGVQAILGSGRPARTISGSDANLLGWLTGRLPAGAVKGAEGQALALSR